MSQAATLLAPQATTAAPAFEGAASLVSQRILPGASARSMFEYAIGPIGAPPFAFDANVCAPTTGAETQLFSSMNQAAAPVMSEPAFSPMIPLIAPAAHVESRYEVLSQWEGTVLHVNASEGEFEAVYRDLTDRSNPDEAATFALSDVSDQDLDLVIPGAVFYWNIGYEILPTGTKKRFSLIRFRRLPRWTKSEIDAIDREGAEMESLFGSGGSYSRLVEGGGGTGDDGKRSSG